MTDDIRNVSADADAIDIKRGLDQATTKATVALKAMSRAVAILDREGKLPRKCEKAAQAGKQRYPAAAKDSVFRGMKVSKMAT